MFRGIAVVATTAAAGVAGAGCAQLAGIDNTSGSNRQFNALAVDRVSIGATVVRSPLDLSGLSATYFPVNAQTGATEALAATVDPDRPGTWVSDLADPTPVEYTLPDTPTPIVRRLSLPYRKVTLGLGVLEHPNREPAPKGGALTISAALDTAPIAGETFSLLAVGAWGTQALTATATTVGPTTFDFSASTNLAGAAGVARISPADAVLVLRHGGAALTGVSEAAPFTQSTSGADTPTFPKMTRVAPDLTLDIKVDPATLMQRFAAARPATGAPTTSWTLVAAPGAQYANTAGPVLHRGSIAVTDVGVNVQYGNPFAAHPTHPWPTLLSVVSSSSRVYSQGAGMPQATLSSELLEYVEPSPGYGVTMPAGLPLVVSLAGTPLMSDGQSVARPAAPFEVTFTVDGPGATLYSVQLIELTAAPAAMVFDRRVAFVATSDEPRFVLRPELLEAGHIYTLRARSVRGAYPGLADGDISQAGLPFSQAFSDSAVFTVTP